ncbi:FRG domain-containing protein [Nafulsella turpanensis]|uniref:FRG domain-containing protein n=1 Tax=Nafulsella turpanensis TaxID=1265690 RepID=UPI00034D3D02|nr:FRG domain-containing protein [Nafulsella turpanensis]
MGQLPIYSSFLEKNDKFVVDDHFFRIDTVEQFDKWYSFMTRRVDEKIEKSKTERTNINNMFRGMGEAKYKLMTSSQRFWITNELEQWWRPRRYLEFIQVFVQNARKKLLFKKVFEYYKLAPNQRDFPILSILQHYGAPTPLMDWTYNLDVALFFASENARPSYSTNEIDHYFSIYHIEKNKQHYKEFYNLLDYSGGSFPQITTFYGWEDYQNSIFYISDFEDKRIPSRSFVDERPITTFYNQNIIPQEGLFIFNPFPDKPLEDCFNTNHSQRGNNLELLPFSCFNIRKDLGEYVRRRIKRNGIDSKFIYPELKKYCNDLVEEFLDQAVER